MNELKLGDVVDARTAASSSLMGRGVIVAICSHPTFVVQMRDGHEVTCVQQLCSKSASDDAFAYWKDRALEAEDKLKARGE